MSLILGLGIPFIAYGIFKSNAIWDFSLLLITGTFLTLIFTALAFNIALSNENKIKGFGYAILLWLFLAVIYDGLFLMSLVIFEDYPLKEMAKNNQIYTFKHQGFWKCMDTLRDKNYLNELWDNNNAKWKTW